jgi:ATP-dependent Clp protease adaptor protein ClpS
MGMAVSAASNPLVARFRAGVAILTRWIQPGFGLSAQVPAPAPVASREPKRSGNETPGNGAAVITRTRVQTKKPSMYRVLLLNDDYTPMEFVISVLQAFFNKDAQEATQIMLQVHHSGVGECGVYTYEIAETKVSQVMDHARKNQHPLQCIMEKK